MPLNREIGEELGDMGRGVIVPLDKWKDTMFYERACQMAAKQFAATGALTPMRFDETMIQVQEYPLHDALAFVFCKQIGGQEYYVPHVFHLTPEVIGELETLGKWKRPEGEAQ